MPTETNKNSKCPYEDDHNLYQGDGYCWKCGEPFSFTRERENQTALEQMGF